MASRAKGQGLSIQLGVPSPSVSRPALPAVDEEQLASSLALLSANNIKAVVWDFDLTLLAIHAYGERITPLDVHGGARSMESDFRDLAFFKRLTSDLTQRGISVAIASFGKYEVIQAYMDKALYGCDRSAEGTPTGEEVLTASLAAAAAAAPSFSSSSASSPAPSSALRLFNRFNILTPSVLGLKDGWSMPSGKNELLEHYRRVTGFGPSQMLFFDDDGANVRKAMEAGYPHCLFTPTGFHFGTFVEACGCLGGGGFCAPAASARLNFTTPAAVSGSGGVGAVDPASFHKPGHR